MNNLYLSDRYHIFLVNTESEIFHSKGQQWNKITLIYLLTPYCEFDREP